MPFFFIRSESEPERVWALIKQSGELFLAKSGESGTEFVWQIGSTSHQHASESLQAAIPFRSTKFPACSERTGGKILCLENQFILNTVKELLDIHI